MRDHRMDGVEEAAEAAKQFAFLENTLLKNRTLTIFGEINKDVAQRTAENSKLRALAADNHWLMSGPAAHRPYHPAYHPVRFHRANQPRSRWPAFSYRPTN